MERKWNRSFDPVQLRGDDAILVISEGDLKGAEMFSCQIVANKEY